MATLAGAVISGSTDVILAGSHENPPRSGAVVDLSATSTLYLMTALNSLGAVVHWTATFADWNAIAWTGGNTPLTNIAARRRLMS